MKIVKVIKAQDDDLDEVIKITMSNGRTYQGTQLSDGQWCFDLHLMVDDDIDSLVGLAEDVLGFHQFVISLESIFGLLEKGVENYGTENEIELDVYLSQSQVNELFDTI